MERCHLFVFLPRSFLSVFVFGRQLPPLVPRAPVHSFAFVFQPVFALLSHSHAELNQCVFQFDSVRVYFVMFYHCNGLRTVTKLLGLHPSVQEYRESPGQESVSNWNQFMVWEHLPSVYCPACLLVLTSSGACDRAWKLFDCSLTCKPLPPADDHYHRRIQRFMGKPEGFCADKMFISQLCLFKLSCSLFQNFCWGLNETCCHSNP